MWRMRFIFFILVVVSVLGGSRMVIGDTGGHYASHRPMMDEDMKGEMGEGLCMKGPGMKMPKMGGPMMKKGMDMGMGMPMMSPWIYLKERLNLTEEQTNKFGKVYSAYRKEVLKKRADIEIAEIELGELLKTKEANEKAIEESANNLESLRSGLNKARVRALIKTREFLSDEQYEDLASFILGWMGHSQMRGACHPPGGMGDGAMMGCQ